MASVGRSVNFRNWLRATEQRPRTAVRPRRDSQIPGVLVHGELRVVYQPIVRMADGSVFAYEALVRSTARLYDGPEALFREATDARCVGALGRAIREMAIAGCQHCPLFLNVHPHEFADGWLVQPDDPVFNHEFPVYLEITESVPLSHFTLCQSTLEEVRAKGIRLAIDDLGAGYSNLKYISELEPHVVKLDRGLVHGIADSPRRRTLVQGMVRLCRDLGAEVVAEGIEHAEDLAILRDIGVHYGQGFLLARPSDPPPEVNWPF